MVWGKGTASTCLLGLVCCCGPTALVQEDQQLQIGEQTTVMARIHVPLQAATLERTNDGLYVFRSTKCHYAGSVCRLVPRKWIAGFRGYCVTLAVATSSYFYGSLSFCSMRSFWYWISPRSRGNGVGQRLAIGFGSQQCGRFRPSWSGLYASRYLGRTHWQMPCCHR